MSFRSWKVAAVIWAASSPICSPSCSRSLRSVGLATAGSYLAVGIGTAAMTLGLMGLSAHLLEQRQSLAGG